MSHRRQSLLSLCHVSGYTAPRISMNELTRLSAWQMAAGIRDRKISVVDLVEAHFLQIERLNAKLNAFVVR